MSPTFNYGISSGESCNKMCFTTQLSTFCFLILYMSRVTRKPVLCAPTRSDTKWAAQPQKIGRYLYFYCRKQRDCTIYVAKTKAPISCTVAAQPICASVYAYAEKQAPRDTVIVSNEVQINGTKRDIKKKKERITC